MGFVHHDQVNGCSRERGKEFRLDESLRGRDGELVPLFGNAFDGVLVLSTRLCAIDL